MEKTARKNGIKKWMSFITDNCDDAQAVNYENRLLCFSAVPFLFVAGLINFFVRFLIMKQFFFSVLHDSANLILLGFAFFAIFISKMDDKRKEHILSALSAYAFLFITIRFYAWIGASVWIFAAIMLILAIGRNSKVMLVYTAVSLLGCSIFIAFCYIPNAVFIMESAFRIVQLCFLPLLLLACAVVHKLNSSRREKAIVQIAEINRQIEERKKAEEENIRLALYDQLTGLPNRTLFYDRLNQALLFAKRNNLETYVLFLDIDFFKIINDTLGHTQGDEIIRQVGQRLSGLLRKSDTVARVGGDEFIIIMQNVKKPLNNFAQSILKTIHMPYIINKQQLSITCSLGIATYPIDGEDAETLVKHADMAMYKAKAEGKNRYAFFSEDLRISANHEMELITSLQSALKHNELQLYYQPQVDCSTGQIVGIEALIRWNHPRLGMIQPNEFISVAERTGLMLPLGEWVIRTACKQNKAWQDEGLPKVPIAVNVSEKQFEHNDLVRQVTCILKETGLDARYLEMELKERVMINEMQTIRRQLEELKKLGVTISVDDFGAGYSSFHYLSQLPVERIKIPIDFIKGIDNNIKDESIITVIIALADNMHLGIVAEGVETKKQLEFLEKRFCKNMQGYYFSKPMPAGDIKRYMEEQKVKIS